MNYKQLIELAIKVAKVASNDINPEPIGEVRDAFNGKLIEKVKCGLFGKGAIVIKKRNRKFAKAIEEYCKENNLYCSYSDYHRGLYCGFAKTYEYERMQEFYSTFRDVLVDNGLLRELFSINVELD